MTGIPACPVMIQFRNSQASCEINLGEQWRVRLQETLIDMLAETLEMKNVEIIY